LKLCLVMHIFIKHNTGKKVVVVTIQIHIFQWILLGFSLIIFAPY